MTPKYCLGDGGKHRWEYREDLTLGRLRECQKCGVLQQRQGSRYVVIGSTRWAPPIPERFRED